MEIKYSKHKQELREDPVLESLLKTKDFVVANSSRLVTVLIVIIFILGVYFIFTSMRKSSIDKAQDAFGRAMMEYTDNTIDKAIDDFRLVIDNHRNTPQGIMSSYMLGSIYYNMKKYDEAITYYETAAAKKTTNFIGAQALEGIANCYEAKGDNASTLKYLEEALNNSLLKFRQPAIRWKMALLTRNNDAVKAKKLCTEIIADSLANEYHQKAENLLAALETGAAG